MHSTRNDEDTTTRPPLRRGSLWPPSTDSAPRIRTRHGASVRGSSAIDRMMERAKWGSKRGGFDGRDGASCAWPAEEILISGGFTGEGGGDDPTNSPASYSASRSGSLNALSHGPVKHARERVSATASDATAAVMSPAANKACPALNAAFIRIGRAWCAATGPPPVFPAAADAAAAPAAAGDFDIAISVARASAPQPRNSRSPSAAPSTGVSNTRAFPDEDAVRRAACGEGEGDGALCSLLLSSVLPVLRC